MSLPETMFQRLREKKIPSPRPRTPIPSRIKGKIRASRYAGNEIANNLTYFRPLSRLKPVRVEDLALALPKGSFAKYKNVYIVKSGTEALLMGKYLWRMIKPGTALVTQSLGEEKNVIRVIFPPYGYYEAKTKLPINRAGTVTATGTIRWRLRQDTTTKNYEFGLFDDRPKPVREYPVAGADNVVLDLAYRFEERNYIYPPPIPSDLSFGDLSIAPQAGFLYFAGRWYKDPTTNNTLRLRWTLRNNTPYTIKARHWGLPISVLYEDVRHVSQVNAELSVSERTISRGYTTTFDLTFNLPAWAYGYVAISHAVNVYQYRHGAWELYWSGGPVFQIMVGRLVMP